MRLAGCVPQDCLARREGRRHDGVLGRHHARLVEKDLGAAELFPAHLVASVDPNLRTELCECVDVRIETAASDHIAAGRRNGHPAESREQRTRE